MKLAERSFRCLLILLSVGCQAKDIVVTYTDLQGPFSDVVCCVEGETAIIYNTKVAKIAEANDFYPYSLGSASSKEYMQEYAKHISNNKALFFSTWAESDKPIARISFNIPNTGSYYIFAFGDAWCCGCQLMRFRIDADNYTVANLWLDNLSWCSLNDVLNSDSKYVTRPFPLTAGKHTLDIMMAAPICGGMIIDKIVVARHLSHKPESQSNNY